jgi:hypothetical protein
MSSSAETVASKGLKARIVPVSPETMRPGDPAALARPGRALFLNAVVERFAR